MGAYLIRHHFRTGAIRVLWWLLAFGPPVVLTAVIVAAVALAEVKLLEGLTK